MSEPLPPRKSMCATCPYRPGSKYAYLQDHLSMTAISDASRICHSTGPANAVHKKPPIKQARICRGSRDIQLKVMCALGIIEEPTDAAWDKAWSKLRPRKPR